MKVAILCPPEISLPMGDQYGGIERIVEDFAEEVGKLCTTTLYCRTDKEEGVRRNYPAGLKELPQLGDVDYIFDFTHQKIAGKVPGLSKKNYAATVFLTDRSSQINDIWPTHACHHDWSLPGPIIYPGIKDVYTYNETKKNYVLFLGRVAGFKRPDIAVLAACRAKVPIIVAGHTGIYAGDPSYIQMVNEMVKVMGLKGSAFIPNVSVHDKVKLLSDARALIIPSEWSRIGSQESFGIVAVEALLSGTPIITSGEGGLREISTPDVGFTCGSLDDYAGAIYNLHQLEPKACRERGKQFTSPRMAVDYLTFATECMEG